MKSEAISMGSVHALKRVKYRGRFMEWMNVALVNRSQELVKESRYVISRSETLMMLGRRFVDEDQETAGQRLKAKHTKQETEKNHRDGARTNFSAIR